VTVKVLRPTQHKAGHFEDVLYFPVKPSYLLEKVTCIYHLIRLCRIRASNQ